LSADGKKAEASGKDGSDAIGAKPKTAVEVPGPDASELPQKKPDAPKAGANIKGN